ncbi:phage repressor protein/antirepressor Ant [Kurthia gibsonii]|uniref:phage antirepressor n=1 Tax=Kurthia gibsonii TaxID=33946 RepID=UPI000EADA098|nr:phage antirepressor [Kurthia gibsonii]RXH52449.1 phage repressor protein/antirepressor Ant [Kurthia gibsonii]
MQQLQTFMYDEQAVRTLFDSKGEVFFVGNDVAKLLGYSNYRNAVINHVDTEDKQRTQIEDAGQSREMTIINESGLYSLILSSKLPTAKQFKRWVTSEVLPNIRKHGTHMTPETIEKVLADPDTIIQIATQLKEERAKRMQAEVVIEQQKPKVLFAQAVETSETSILVGQLAKLLTQNGVNIGQNRLFSWLRENGYLGKKGAHYNEPTQYAVERGWFEVVERTMQNPDGSVRITRTTKVTGKGQVYFINKLLTKAV